MVDVFRLALNTKTSLKSLANAYVDNQEKTRRSGLVDISDLELIVCI